MINKIRSAILSWVLKLNCYIITFDLDKWDVNSDGEKLVVFKRDFDRREDIVEKFYADNEVYHVRRK